jgi:hypothetical protein
MSGNAALRGLGLEEFNRPDVRLESTVLFNRAVLSHYGSPRVKPPPNNDPVRHRQIKEHLANAGFRITSTGYLAIWLQDIVERYASSE